MYICTECGCRFPVPAYAQGDTYEAWGFTKTETLLVCPNCGSPAYVEEAEVTIKLNRIIEEYNIDNDTLIEIIEDMEG